jgi:hypothetical protein
MELEEDPLRRGMRVERLRRDDGRALLLYHWPDHAETAPPSAAKEPPLDPWSPDSGPADV